MGVSADGGLYACHRFVNDEDGHHGRCVQRRGSATSSPAGSRAAISRSNLPAAAAGHVIFAPEAATTRRSSADALHATTFAAGWTYCLVLYTELLRTQPDTLKRILASH